MPTLIGPLGVGHSVPIMGSLHDRNQTANGMTDPSTHRLEATFDPITMEAIAPWSKVCDHLLLIIQAMINGTPLPALVDSGATRSFIDEKFQLRPPPLSLVVPSFSRIVIIISRDTGPLAVLFPNPPLYI